MWRTWGALAVLLSAASPRLWRLYSSWRLQSLVFDDSKDYALVFSMAKVASTSMWVGINAHSQIFDYHDEINETYKSIMKTHVPDVAKDFLRKVPEGRRIWVFTAVRNPFARMASEYWEDIEEERHFTGMSQEQILDMDMSEMHLDFLQNATLDIKDNWFSTVFKDLVGVDLTRYPFPFEAGRLMVEGVAFGRPLVVVLLRAEEVGVWWDIMRHNVPMWTPDHKQNADKLWYGKKYREFRRTFRWPGWAVFEIAEGDSLHFYTIGERAAFCRKAFDPSFNQGS